MKRYIYPNTLAIGFYMNNTSNHPVIQPRTITFFQRFMTIFISLLLSNIVHAENAPEDFSTVVEVGAGIKYNSAPYYGLDGYAEPYPVFDIQYGAFFVNDLTAGLTLLYNNSVTLSLAISYNQMKLDTSKPKNEDVLYWGIKDRDPTVEAGFIGTYHAKIGLLEATYFHDINGVHKGARASMKISHPVPDTGYWTVVPGFFVNYYSKKYNDYYYGITKAENDTAVENFVIPAGGSESTYRATRPVYTGKNTAHVGVDIETKYALTNNLNVIANVVVEQSSGQINNSSLVEDDVIITSVLGLSYKF